MREPSGSIGVRGFFPLAPAHSSPAPALWTLVVAMASSSDDVIGSDEAVAEQARMFETPGTPWYAVSKGTLSDLMAIWPPTPCCRPHHVGVSPAAPCPVCGCTADVFARGPVGENVLHLCVLFHTPESIKMAKYLVERFGPSLVNAPYQTRSCMTDAPGLYEGEVALHIAIVQRDLDLVLFLLKHGARLDAHAIGAFFGPGRVYFGETPFAFAASMGDKKIVRALLDHAREQGGEKNRDAVMRAVDAYGNNALHMCVMNNQLEMHDFLVDECGFPESDRNNAGMTPFIQTAHEGNARAFNAILKRRFSVVWTYGPVTNYSLSLENIDTVGKDPHSLDPSVIDVILKRGHLHLLNHPILVAVLEMKWAKFGKAAFQRNIAFYAVFLGIFTWQVNMHASERGDVHEWRSPSRTVVEWVTFLCALGMFAQHCRDVAYFVRAYYRQLHNVRLNYVNADMPLYCLPGQRMESKTNGLQMPRKLRVIRPRRGTKFGKTGSMCDPSARGAKSVKRLTRSAALVDSDDENDGSSSAAFKMSLTTKPASKTRRKVSRDLDADASPVFVTASSVRARRRWRLLREHWLSQRSCVGLYQIARQRELQHGDDYDDRVMTLLHVNVLEARGLVSADSDGSLSDPYVTVCAAPGVRARTHVVKDDLNPTWSRAFSFTAPPGIRRSGNALTFRVVDHDDFDFDDELGMCSVEYHDVPYVAPGMVPPGPVWLTLKPREKKKRRKSLSSGLPASAEDERSRGSGELSLFSSIERVREKAQEFLGPSELRRKMAEAAKEAEVNDGGDDADASSRRGAEETETSTARLSLDGEEKEDGGPKRRAEGGPERAPLGKLLVEVYYEVCLPKETKQERDAPRERGTEGEDGRDGSKNEDPSKDSGSDESKDEDPSSSASPTAPPKSRHTAFERGAGAAKQESALRARLLELGYAVASGREGSERTQSAGVSDASSSDASLSDATGSPFALRPEGPDPSGALAAETDGDDAAERLESEGDLARRWAALKSSLANARGALAFYVHSVLAPQPSLVLNLAHIVLQAAHFFTWQFSNGPGVADDVVFALAAITAWGFTLYFAAGYESVGFLTVIVIGCVKDVVRFSSLWAIVFAAFSQAIFVLDASWARGVAAKRAAEIAARNDVTGSSAVTDWDAIWTRDSQGEVLWKLFAVSTTASSFDDVFPEEDTDRVTVKTLYTLLGVIFQVQMAMLMLNVIIAMFNQTYINVSNMAREQWRLQWALKIILAEAQLPSERRFAYRLGEDAQGPDGEKIRVHNFEINAGPGSHDSESLEAAVSDLLTKER